MALDAGLVGRSYPPSAVYEVGREKIAEFAAALGDPDPVYLDPPAARAAGHPDVIAPPTFAIVLSLGAGNVVVEDPDVDIDYSRVVHGEQRFTHHRPIRAGDRLVATATIDAVKTIAGNDMLTTRVDLATEDGEPVCTTRSMRVARGVGLPDVIAHGMLTAGIAVRAVTRWAGDPGAVVDYQVRFSRPVVVPDDESGAELTVRGRVAAIGEDGRVRVDLTVTSGGEKVLSLARVLVALS